jgi:UDP:flavonoid glycosyltransferase YjiC (YdhE family)
VRILFSFAGGSGHAEPLVPLARAAEVAGHTVAFAGKPVILPALAALGFGAFPTGPDDLPRRRPLVEVDTGREDRVLRDGFAGRIARARATDVLALCAEWRPDVVVCDETDFGAMVAAERLGLPSATVLVTAAGSFVRHELLADALNALRAEHGLPPDPEPALPGRQLVLSPFPPGYRDPAFPLPVGAHGLRPAALGPPPGDVAPPWLSRLDGPLVYVTLGTVFNLESGDLFARLLAGLRELPVDVVVTVGSQLDPAELGPLPGNVHVERYVVQALLLPSCSAVVCHGGSGSVIGALAHGLPLVVVPLGADQPQNAARCEELGVGRVLDAVRATPEEVREAVSEVLSNPSYRAAAERLRDETAALPGPEHAVALLERLAAETRV